MRYRILLIAMYLFLASGIKQAHAQYNNNWPMAYHFGMNFNACSLLIDNTDHKIGHPHANVSSSICDSLGNIVLYTTGDSVWDNFGNAIKGNPLRFFDYKNTGSAGTSGTLILPKGKSGYWIFYNFDSIAVWAGRYGNIALMASINSGIYSSIIDKGLDGNWQIDPANKGVLVNPNFSYCNMTAVKSIKAYEYWLISRMSDTLLAYHLDSNKISPPIKTTITEPLNDLLTKTTEYILCPSLDGKKLISLSQCGISDTSLANVPQGCYAYLYSFNYATGAFGDQQVLDSFKLREGTSERLVRNAAFSPNDSLIYLAELGGGAEFGAGLDQKIWQYQRYNTDLLGSRTDILGSRDTTISNSQIIDMKFGPDGKIYILSNPSYNRSVPTNHISVINFPDKAGVACDLELNIINKQGTSQMYDDALYFPNTLNQYINLKYSTTPICGGFHFTAIHDSLLKSFTWLVTSASGFVASGTGEQADILLHTPGWYQVQVMGYTSAGYARCYMDSLRQINYPKASFTVANDTVCAYNKFLFSGTVLVDSTRAADSKTWYWDFGDPVSQATGADTSTVQNPYHIYTQPGSYTVKLVGGDGLCTDTFTYPRNIIVRPTPVPGFVPSPPSGCAPLLVNFERKPDSGVVKYLYLFGDSASDTVVAPKHLYTLPGIYKAMQYIYAASHCVTIDSQTITVFQGLDANLKTDISTVTVDSNNTVLVLWDTVHDATRYNLMRTMDNGTSQQALTSTANHSYTDNEVDPFHNIYTYRITATDTCSNTTGQGLEGTSILLKGVNDNNEFAALTWSPYKTWRNGIKSYAIQRKDNNNRFNTIATVPANVLAYNDQSFFTDSINTRTYRVTAMPNDTAVLPSQSNVVPIEVNFILWVPNVYTPNGDGRNDKFKITTLAGTKISLHIYNRWGELVYTSNDINQSWDGTFRGNPVPPDIYLYKLEVKSPFSGDYYKSGTVEILK